MQKVYIAAAREQQDKLLNALGDLQVIHPVPVEPDTAVADEQTLGGIDRLQRALQILEAVSPGGHAPDISPLDAAEETLDIQRAAAELSSRLTTLHQQIEQLAVWGDVRIEQFEQLARAGIEVKFFSLPAAVLDEVSAEVVQPVAELPGKRRLIAVIDRTGQAQLPEQAEPVELPSRDRPDIRAEAARIDQTLKDNSQRLVQLAHLTEPLRRELVALQDKADFTVAGRGGLSGEDIFAIQGWVPAATSETLADDLENRGVAAAVAFHQPDPPEEPPTLIEYTRWAKPIKGLFDMLGTLPGYREMDLGPFFMIAMPIFAAMLIGDAGYGLIFLLVPAIFYRKIVAAAGSPSAHFLMVMGAATIIWGLLTGVIFGVTPQNLIDAEGWLAAIGRGLAVVQVVKGTVQQQAYAIMKISFVMAAIHLSIAQLRQALALAPALAMLSKIGWAVFLWGIFCVIWYLFFASQAGAPPHRLTPYLLIAGGAMAILFACPSRNPFKMVGIGIAQFPLSALGTFSDSISYIRLMGVGLASTIIGQTFNSLGAQVADSATWFVGIFVALFGHSLNIAMCMIAILAHGVRLNMLEFSNNAGVQWAGYAYSPFTTTIKES